MLKELLDIFLTKKTIGQVISERPQMGEAAVAFVIAALISGIASLFGIILLGLIQGSLGAASNVIVLGAVSAVVAVVFAVIFLIISALIYYIIAKILGGQGGGFGQFLANLFKVAASIQLAGAIVFWIPFIGGLLSILVGLWGLYLYYQLVRDYFMLSSLRAVFVVILIPVLFIVLALIIVLLLGMTAFTAMSSSAGPGMVDGLVGLA